MSKFPSTALDLLEILIYLWLGVFLIAIVGLDIIPWICSQIYVFLWS